MYVNWSRHNMITLHYFCQDRTVSHLCLNIEKISFYAHVDWKSQVEVMVSSSYTLLGGVAAKDMSSIYCVGWSFQWMLNNGHASDRKQIALNEKYCVQMDVFMLSCRLVFL